VTALRVTLANLRNASLWKAHHRREASTLEYSAATTSRRTKDWNPELAGSSPAPATKCHWVALKTSTPAMMEIKFFSLFRSRYLGSVTGRRVHVPQASWMI